MKKRKKGVLEKWKRYGKQIVIVVVQERDFFIAVRHVGRIKASKKKCKLLRGE